MLTLEPTESPSRFSAAISQPRMAYRGSSRVRGFQSHFHDPLLCVSAPSAIKWASSRGGALGEAERGEVSPGEPSGSIHSHDGTVGAPLTWNQNLLSGVPIIPWLGILSLINGLDRSPIEHKSTWRHRPQVPALPEDPFSGTRSVCPVSPSLLSS